MNIKSESLTQSSNRRRTKLIHHEVGSRHDEAEEMKTNGHCNKSEEAENNQKLKTLNLLLISPKWKAYNDGHKLIDYFIICLRS
jgi:hypothetical protein